MTYKCLLKITENYRKLVQHGNYENVLLNIMNASTKIFPNRYHRVSNQSCGECDFIDLTTNQKFEAKLMISKNQGKNIGSINSNLESYVQEYFEEVNEFNRLGSPVQFDATKSKFYQLCECNLMNIEKDETPILFLPFPLFVDRENMLYGQFAVACFLVQTAFRQYLNCFWSVPIKFFVRTQSAFGAYPYYFQAYLRLFFRRTLISKLHIVRTFIF